MDACVNQQHVDPRRAGACDISGETVTDGQHLLALQTHGCAGNPVNIGEGLAVPLDHPALVLVPLGQ